MAIPGSYTIHYTDPRKTEFVINPNTTDGPLAPTVDLPFPGSTSWNTSLLFYGKGVQNYGEKIAEDFVQLLDNFAGPIPPISPTHGQLWLDTGISATINSANLTSNLFVVAGNVGYGFPDGCTFQTIQRTVVSTDVSWTVTDWEVTGTPTYNGGTDETTIAVTGSVTSAYPNSYVARNYDDTTLTGSLPQHRLKIYWDPTYAGTGDWISANPVSYVGTGPTPGDTPSHGDLWFDNDTDPANPTLKLYDESSWLDLLGLALRTTGGTVTGDVNFDGYITTNNAELQITSNTGAATPTEDAPISILGVDSPAFVYHGAGNSSTLSTDYWRAANLGHIHDAIEYSLTNAGSGTFVSVAGDEMTGDLQYRSDITSLGIEWYHIVPADVRVQVKANTATNILNIGGTGVVDPLFETRITHPSAFGGNIIKFKSTLIEPIVPITFLPSYTPTNNFDAATKIYVDTLISGIANDNDYVKSLTFSAPDGVVSAVSISNPGLGYNVNDVLTLSGGAGNGLIVTVATINGSGGINSVTITNGGLNYIGSENNLSVDLNNSSTVGTNGLFGIDSVFASTNDIDLVQIGAGAVADHNIDLSNLKLDATNIYFDSGYETVVGFTVLAGDGGLTVEQALVALDSEKPSSISPKFTGYPSVTSSTPTFAVIAADEVQVNLDQYPASTYDLSVGQSIQIIESTGGVNDGTYIISDVNASAGAGSPPESLLDLTLINHSDLSSPTLTLSSAISGYQDILLGGALASDEVTVRDGSGAGIASEDVQYYFAADVATSNEYTVAGSAFVGTTDGLYSFTEVASTMNALAEIDVAFNTGAENSIRVTATTPGASTIVNIRDDSLKLNNNNEFQYIIFNAALNLTDLTSLDEITSYDFDIYVGSAGLINVTIETPDNGGSGVSIADLIAAMNTGLAATAIGSPASGWADVPQVLFSAISGMPEALVIHSSEEIVLVDSGSLNELFSALNTTAIGSPTEDVLLVNPWIAPFAIRSPLFTYYPEFAGLGSQVMGASEIIKSGTVGTSPWNVATLASLVASGPRRATPTLGNTVNDNITVPVYRFGTGYNNIQVFQDGLLLTPGDGTNGWTEVSMGSPPTDELSTTLTVHPDTTGTVVVVYVYGVHHLLESPFPV